jgi:cardiolipin synthase (CMP-forming)
MFLKNIPNILTLLRLFLIIPFVMYFNHKEYVIAFYIFLIAGLTDALDGWLARFFNWQSSFGSLVDPIADKLLITISVLALAITQQLPWWFVILVFLRDLTISCGVIAWYAYIKQHIIFQPTYISKINTTLQLTLITFSFFELAYAFKVPMFHNALLIITTLTTTISYIDYVWHWGQKAYNNSNTAKS